MLEVWIIIRNYVITAVVAAVLGFIVAKVKLLAKEQNALKAGILSLLRGDIIRSHDKYTEKGYCPLYAREATEKAYQAYHALGGNGSITGLWEEIQRLPTKKDTGGDDP